ncbi:hypothetical protein [Roseobacter sinensis]|uniref:Uncharacterized protein n=1 Tax=Roseobacter sinensis TaxID=2931391 RepID=A0ABT3BKS4_9RHOB|nr:hypothetical protein [Roseobacter sp. WL0113]MCV3274177.1 hypothetical protein [Roseobacter sp. WL0113]
MPSPLDANGKWWGSGPIQGNPFDKNESCEFAPTIFAQPRRTDAEELKTHPEFQGSASDVQDMRAFVTSSAFDAAGNAPYGDDTVRLRTVGADGGSGGLPNTRHTVTKQRSHDAASNRTNFTGYVFDPFGRDHTSLGSAAFHPETATRRTTLHEMLAVTAHTPGKLRVVAARGVGGLLCIHALPRSAAPNARRPITF